MKKITVLFTVLMMLAASSAFAVVNPEFPAFYNQTLSTKWSKQNGTQLFYTGFGVNATAGVAAGKTNGKIQFYASNRSETTKSEIFLFNATLDNGGFFNGTFTAENGTKLTGVYFANGTKTIKFNDSFGNVAGLMTIYNNATLNATSYFVPAGNYQMVVGLTNATANATSLTRRTGYPDSGLSMSLIYQNGTFKDIASSDNEWDYYAYGQRKGYPVVVYGKVKITATTGAANARVKYFMNNGTATSNQASDWDSYNATGLTKGTDGGYISLATDDALTLFENGTINEDGNFVTGFANLAGQRLFAVMAKSATTVSKSDVKSRAFTLVYAGSGTTVKNNLGNATAGMLQFNIDENMELSGNGRTILTTATSGSVLDTTDVDLGSYTATLADTTQFILSQSNMTISNAAGTVVGSFYGKQAADKMFSVGVYETIDSGITHRSLAFLIPTSAVTSSIQNAGAGYQNNGTFVGSNFTTNSTAYTQAELKARWTSIPSDFTPLTEVKGFSITSNAAQRGDFYYTAQYKMTGIGGKIEKLRLYKVMPDSTTTREFSYASSATPSADGSWWISTLTADGYLNDQSVLSPNDEYFVNWVVKDNGNYDSNATAEGIVDPVVLGSVPSGSSSSSGCVFNPAAGFGLEWLLLMLAPMVAVVRSRFK